MKMAIITAFNKLLPILLFLTFKITYILFKGTFVILVCRLQKFRLF